MSTEEPQTRTATPGGDVGKAVGNRRDRDYGARLLEDEPDLTPAMFAGRLFDRRGTSPDTAIELFDELTEG